MSDSEQKHSPKTAPPSLQTPPQGESLSRRNFFGLVAGAFAVAAVPGEAVKLLKQVVEPVIPPFPIEMVKFRHYAADPMQAIIPFKAILNHGPIACECGWVGTGLYCFGSITEVEMDKCGSKEAALHLVEAKKLNMFERLEDLWNEMYRTKRLIHAECPLA